MRSAVINNAKEYYNQSNKEKKDRKDLIISKSKGHRSGLMIRLNFHNGTTAHEKGK
jgi:hypothetical protein